MSKKKLLNNYAKYSGMAFQMGAIIFGGTYGGVKLDEYLQWDFPIFTLVFCLVSVFLAVYFPIREFLKPPK
jgi:hypothetical protein